MTFRTLLVSRKLLALASLKKSGTTTFSRVMSAFCTVRSEILFSIFVALYPGSRGVHEEALDLVVGDVPGVDDHPVGESRVADPALGAVEDPVVAVPPGRGARAAGDVGAAQRLGQAEGADLLERVDVRQPGVLLLLGRQGFDGAGEEPVVDAHERGDGGVRAGGLRVQDAGEEVGVALPPDRADQVDLGQLRESAPWGTRRGSSSRRRSA